MRLVRTQQRSTVPDTFIRPSPFQDDCLVGDEYAETRRPRQRMPEKRLMLAVLDRAIDEYLRYRHVDSDRARRRTAEVLAWIEADDHDWPFSFVSICDALGLEAEYLRGGLRRSTAARLPIHPGVRPTARLSTAAEIDRGVKSPMYAVGNIRGRRRAAI